MLDIDISDDAKDDIENLYDYIAFELLDEDAALGYRMGLYDTIEKLSYLGEVIAFSQQPYIQKRFGIFARTITYKKMTIVYEVITGVAYVHRVIPSKMIY